MRIKAVRALTAPARRSKDYPYLAVSRKPEALIYGAYGSKAWLWGKIRLGQRIPVRHKVSRQGCRRGNWYESPGGTYICNTHGFTITKEDLDAEVQTPPRLTSALPYAYYKATVKPTLRFSEVPSPAELRQALAALEGKDDMPEVVQEAKEGAYFIALDGVVREEAGTFYRSTEGLFVRKQDVERVAGIPMHGELLGSGKNDGTRLPLAFVHLEEAPLWCLPRGTSVRGIKGGKRLTGLRPCGAAQRHARFVVAHELKVGDTPYVLSARGLALPRNAVRVAGRIDRPRGVGASDKWVHFDLSQQTMVAYEGDRPVMATLISSGKEGHNTPAGTYRIYLKHISDRMKGDDPKDGPYDIGEVPWVMYYKSSYAVHGAYWHNTFGNVRSHGCTNLAPADARWLYFWTEPEVPKGWHSKYARQGTQFHYTY